MRTYYPLYEYYLPRKIQTPGYYSKEYAKRYTDGYGYDFYYGGYGFYEYSKLPVRPALAVDDDNVSLYLTVAISLVVFCLCCFTLVALSAYFDVYHSGP